MDEYDLPGAAAKSSRSSARSTTTSAAAATASGTETVGLISGLDTLYTVLVSLCRCGALPADDHRGDLVGAVQRRRLRRRQHLSNGLTPRPPC